MLVTNIPYFREVILMSFSCAACGHKNNEVKASGAIPDKGKRYVLRNAHIDLTRSVLKSESAEVFIPELQLELTSGTLGGKFTTIEGLLDDVDQSLGSNPFIRDGDSKEDSEKWEDFFSKLNKMKKGEMAFTFCMEDPLAVSHIQNIYAPDDDPDLGIEEFDRTFEQDEELGLHDMVV
jgi:zinc finger protein